MHLFISDDPLPHNSVCIKIDRTCVAINRISIIQYCYTLHRALLYCTSCACSQSRQRGDHGVPVAEVVMAVVLRLSDVEYLVHVGGRLDRVE